MLRVLPLFKGRLCPVILLLCLNAGVLAAQNQSKLGADTSAQVDEIAGKVLATTGVPSASVAVVKDGAAYPQKTLSISIYEMPDGKFEQFLISAVE